MHKQVYSFSEQQNCFYNAQFGFHLSLSTNNALMLIPDTSSQLDQNKFCAGALVDLKFSFKRLSYRGS